MKINSINPSLSERKQSEKSGAFSWILSLPGMIWLLFFFMVPYLIIFLYSFLKPTAYDIIFTFTMKAYQESLSAHYLHSFAISARLAFLTTLLTLFLGYPVAYTIAKSSGKMKNFLLVLIIIPFWTNFIIRIFSWRIFLAPNGILNFFIQNVLAAEEPLRLLRTDFAVVLVMIYVYLPYMILPLYSVLEKMDFTLLDAAKDLGANSFKSFMKITLPLSKEGILAGSILVFIPSLGAYIIPQIVGNQNSLYIGQIITYKIKNIPRNWPLASALSFFLLVLITIILALFYYTNKKLKNKSRK